MSQPSTIDFITPFDPTGYSSITGAQLEQLTAGLQPALSQGLVLSTTDIAGIPQVPDAVTNTKWQRYFWVRQTSSTVITYAWASNGGTSTDPSTGTNLLNWKAQNTIAIGAGSIQGSQIAASTVTGYNIAAGTITSDKLSSSISVTPSGNITAGDLQGSSYPSPVIAPATITNSKIAAATILGSNIAAKTVTAGNIQAVGSAGQMLRNQTADPTVVEWFAPPTILMGGGSALEATIGASKLQNIQVNAAGTGYQYSAHNVLQIVGTKSQVTNYSTTKVLAMSTTATTANVDLIPSLTTVFTPISATSTIMVEATVPLRSGVGSGIIGLFLFVGSATIGATAVNCATSVNCSGTVVAQIASTGAAITIGVGAASTDGTAVYANARDNAGGTLYGGSIMLLKITEFI